MPKTKAETSFEKKRREALKARDSAAVERVYSQYGSYLELVGEDEPVGKRRFFQYPSPARTGKPVAR